MNQNNKKLMSVCTIVLLVVLSSCSSGSEREQSVGRAHKLFFDDSRLSWVDDDQRPIAVTIWYPAVKGSQEEDWNIAIFEAGRSAVNAELASTPQKFPLIVLSHGTGGAAFQLSWLAEQLVQQGFMVLAVNHHGNTGAEESLLLEGFMLWWERTLDISSAIDQLLVDPDFAHRIDAKQIAAAGFSLGGYTVLSLAGGITDRKKWQAFCSENQANPICVLPPEAGDSVAQIAADIEANPRIQDSISRSAELFLDQRIRAVYSIAPVLGPAFNKDSLAKISIPTRIVVGADDAQAIPQYNAQLFADSIPQASLLELVNVSHYTFLAPCNFKGRSFVKTLCQDGEDIKRKEVHQNIAADAVSFFTEAFAAGSKTP